MDKLLNYGGAYTRYEYPTNGIQSKAFSTIIDTNNNGADAADEVLSESWTDSAGETTARVSSCGALPLTDDLSSTVLGAKIAEYNCSGTKTKASV